MKPVVRNQWPLIAVIGFMAFLYIRGIAGVPFHPDESTQLFMSQDVENFFTDPSGLFWQPDSSADLRQQYRLLDAPLTRYLIGLARWVGGRQALPQDWDWSKTWEENHQAGALPDPSLLLTARLGVAFLFPLSLFLMYKIGESVGESRAGWCAMLLLGSNALVLLHTRRAMAESALLFTILLVLYFTLSQKRARWLIALPASLAFCTKQSAGVLLIAGLVALFWSLPGQNQSLKRLAQNLTSYFLLSALTILLLNPFMWQDPIRAVDAAAKARRDLLERQVAALSEQRLASPQTRVAGVLAQLYFSQPTIAEVANYLDETRADEIAYLSNPIHRLGRGLAGAMILLVMTLFGLALSGLKLMRCPGLLRRRIGIIWLAGALQATALLLAVPLPFQRYYLPLLPYVCLWAGYGFSEIVLLIKNKLQAG